MKRFLIIFFCVFSISFLTACGNTTHLVQVDYNFYKNTSNFKDLPELAKIFKEDPESAIWICVLPPPVKEIRISTSLNLSDLHLDTIVDQIAEPYRAKKDNQSVPDAKMFVLINEEDDSVGQRVTFITVSVGVGNEDEVTRYGKSIGHATKVNRGTCDSPNLGCFREYEHRNGIYYKSFASKSQAILHALKEALEPGNLCHEKFRR